MNTRFFNKVVLQSLRQSNCRYLSVQHNINTCHAVNFHKRQENHSCSFVFTKFSNGRALCQSSLPVYASFQRNFSGTSHLNKEAIDPLKNLEAPSSVEVTESAAANVASSDFGDNILVEHAQQLFMQMHEASGLPWWATIVLTTFAIRTSILLPFAVTQIRVMAKLEKVNLELTDIEKELKKESVKAQKKLGWPQHLANQKYEDAKDKAWWGLVGKENCHPMKAYFLICMQMVTWISMTSGLFSLCSPDFVGPNIVNEMANGGFGWITDLTKPDSSLILPFSLGILNLLLVEIHNSFKVIRKSKQEQWTTLFFRVASIATIPLAAYSCSAINIYWLSSSMYGILQAFILNSSPSRRLFRVPTNHPGLKQPYRYFLKHTKERLRLSKGETALTTK